MRPYEFWIHQNFMDVCCEIMRVQYRGPKYVKVKILWWNRGYTGNPWKISYTPQTIKILREDLNKWKRLLKPELSRWRNPG